MKCDEHIQPDKRKERFTLYGRCLLHLRCWQHWI